MTALEIHEHRTETQRIEDAITKACQDIRELWDDTLPTGTPARPISASSRGGGIIAADNDPTNADIDPTTRALSARRHTLDILRPWCALIIDDRPVKNPTTHPNTNNAHDMAAFIERHAQWLSGHQDATDARDELQTRATELTTLQPPRMTHDEYLRTARPERWFIGRCPLAPDTNNAQPQPEPTEPEPPCDGRVYAYPDDTTTEERHINSYDRRRDPWAVCDRCGTRGVTTWWERTVFNTETARVIGVDDIIRIAATQFGRHISKQAVWQWVSRGKLTPVDRNQKPHQFNLTDVIDTLTAREAG